MKIRKRFLYYIVTICSFFITACSYPKENINFSETTSSLAIECAEAVPIADEDTILFAHLNFRSIQQALKDGKTQFCNYSIGISKDRTLLLDNTNTLLKVDLCNTNYSSMLAAEDGSWSCLEQYDSTKQEYFISFIKLGEEIKKYPLINNQLENTRYYLNVVYLKDNRILIDGGALLCVFDINSEELEIISTQTLDYTLKEDGTLLFTNWNHDEYFCQWDCTTISTKTGNTIVSYPTRKTTWDIEKGLLAEIKENQFIIVASKSNSVRTFSLPKSGDWEIAYVNVTKSKIDRYVLLFNSTTKELYCLDQLESKFSLIATDVQDYKSTQSVLYWMDSMDKGYVNFCDGTSNNVLIGQDFVGVYKLGGFIVRPGDSRCFDTITNSKHIFSGFYFYQPDLSKLY